MRRPSSLAVLLALSACASPSPTPTPTPTSPAIDCGSVAETLCRSVADAAELMTGTAPLLVAELPVPTDDGIPIEERYVVTLEPESGETEAPIIEVVRFEGSENWSARRLEAMPSD
jgi:hypothetical protein